MTLRAFAAAGIAIAAAGAAAAAPLRIGLYADQGCRGAGAAIWARIIDGSPDAELTLLSGEDLRNGALSGVDLFVSPGGAGGPQTAAMGEEGMAAVRKYVAEGGKCLGTCCGFSNLLNERPSFAKRNTMVPFARIPGIARGGFTGAVRFTEAGRKMFGAENRDYFIRYHNGPIVYRTEDVPPCSNVVVLATMNSELSEVGPVTNPMFGAPAIVGCDYGKGRMILFNNHLRKVLYLILVQCFIFHFVFFIVPASRKREQQTNH